MDPFTILGGLVSEAIARSAISYSNSMTYYNLRVRKGQQPSTPFINVFDVRQQNILLITANSIYLLVTIILFIIMKKKPTGYRLRWLLVIYDAINVIVAAYIAISIINYKLGHGGLLLCNSIANDEAGYKIANIFVLFYFHKYFEFIDTWFFILRKSKRTVTLLHLFHHSSITIVVGTILPFDYNGDMYLPIMLNSINHMLVYLHYLLASLGVQSLWAKYITSMQLVQFIIIFLQSLISYRVGPTCGSPDFAKVLMTWYMGSLIAVFGNYFLQKYIFRRPNSAVDMCGVIKQPSADLNLKTEHDGMIELDSTGSAIVFIFKNFPDINYLNKHVSTSSSPTSSGHVTTIHPQSSKETIHGQYLIPTFQVIYQVTAVGQAMPNLYIHKEVTHYQKYQSYTNLIQPSSKSIITTATATNTTTAAMTPKKSTSVAAVISSSSVNPTQKISTCGRNEVVKVNSHNLTHGTRNTSPGRDDSNWWKSTEQFNDDLLNQTSGKGCNISNDNNDNNQYTTNTSNTTSIVSPTKKASSTSDLLSKSINRSSSTGDLTKIDGNSMTKSKSHDQLLYLQHNDRLIDGPLPLEILRETYLRQFGGNGSTTDENKTNGHYKITREEIHTLTKCVINTQDSSNSSLTTDKLSDRKVKSPESHHDKNKHKQIHDKHSHMTSDTSSLSSSLSPAMTTKNKTKEPLCYFVISGGVPGGKVCWSMKTVPVKLTRKQPPVTLLNSDWRSISLVS